MMSEIKCIIRLIFFCFFQVSDLIFVASEFKILILQSMLMPVELLKPTTFRKFSKYSKQYLDSELDFKSC